MPIFLFGCDRCGGEREAIQSFASNAPICCGAPMVRLPACPAIIEIKGAGGVKAHSKGYKEGYAKNYRRRLEDAKS